MKKIIALALVAVMVLAFAACAKQNGENSTTAPSDDQKRQPQSALEILEKVWSKYSTDEKFPATGGSEKNIKDMMTSQFRSGREKTRKREISRDFSRFFDPEFFRSFIDPFCPFRCCVRTRTHEKGFFFFASSRKQSTLWLDSDLRKRRRSVRKSCRFTNCLQTQLIPPQIVWI